MNNPPTSGPTIAATPHVAATSPSAAPRRSGGMRSAIAAVATGKMPPAPKAWIARAARNIGKFCEKIASSEPSAKIETQAMYTGRRPFRSASFVMIGMLTTFASR